VDHQSQGAWYLSVAELFGGPTRSKVRLYWSHCGSSRVRHHELLGTPPIETWADITALGKEVVARVSRP
jgi:hypothetical protein